MKKHHLPRLAFLAAVILQTSTVSAGLFGPSDYGECILDSMKGVASDMAAKVIMATCLNEYEEKNKSEKELSSEQVRLLSGRVGLRSGEMSGHIYNGNKDVMVTQVTIVLTVDIGRGGLIRLPDDFFEGRILPLDGDPFKVAELVLEEGGKKVRRVVIRKAYNVSVTILPLTVKNFSVKVVDEGPEEFSWNFTKARGY